MDCQTRLFVGNLPEKFEDNDLKKAFSSFGQVLNVDVKNKSGNESNKKNFAFVTLSASDHKVDTCIKYFLDQDFHGKTLYVTRARESFLERLQRERQQGQDKLNAQNNPALPIKQPKLKLGEYLNPRKRKIDNKTEKPVTNSFSNVNHTSQKHVGTDPQPGSNQDTFGVKDKAFSNDKKKQDADKKRLESLRKKRQDFKEKVTIIKNGLVGIDAPVNKKVIFSDSNDTQVSKNSTKQVAHKPKPKVIKRRYDNQSSFLFDDDDGSGEDISFDIKEQFEGKKGQKVLDLQSRYKSDKRFVLDERFIGDNETESEDGQEEGIVELQQHDEKRKQLDILQDVLGVAIKSHSSNETNNKKTKMGMLRFDPTQPEHAKFFAPVNEKPEPIKKSKKKKSKDEQKSEILPEPNTQPEPSKIEVSKETFYKVSDTLKEAIAQPTTFSLRSLFGTNEQVGKEDVTTEQETGYIPLETPKQPKVKNPFASGDKNPFMYDSSESEDEKEEDVKDNSQPEKMEVAAVWKENLFFTDSDFRLKEGLAFFNKPLENEGQKERRELKSLMKKRIYNNERKNQMFQKKIGGRKKTMKKSYNKSKSNKR